MTREELVGRMKDYFARQTAWFEDLRTELASLEHDLTDAGMERWAGQRQVRGAQTAAFEREFAALQRAWDTAAGLTEEDRREVRASAHRAADLADQVCALLERTSSCAREHAAAVQESLEELRRGRDVLTKYGGRSPQPARFIDRKT